MTVKEAMEKVKDYMKEDDVSFRFGRDYNGLFLFYISPKDSVNNERDFSAAKIVVMKNSGKVIPEIDLDKKDLIKLRGEWKPIDFDI